jgi:hypothetical protein
MGVPSDLGVAEVTRGSAESGANIREFVTTGKGRYEKSMNIRNDWRPEALEFKFSATNKSIRVERDMSFPQSLRESGFPLTIDRLTDIGFEIDDSGCVGIPYSVTWIRGRSSDTAAPVTVVSNNQQGGITAAQVNINPPPQVIASKQTTKDTGNLELPWVTLFTLHSTGLVATGDLRLKCSGSVLKAAIGRINLASFISGSNGPDPNDPTVLVYQLGQEMLSPGRDIQVEVYSEAPIRVLSGSIGEQEIHFN